MLSKKIKYYNFATAIVMLQLKKLIKFIIMPFQKKLKIIILLLLQ
jgi:hypothetical protein